MELLGKTGNENVYRALDYYANKFSKKYAVIGKLPDSDTGADKNKFLLYDLSTSTISVVDRYNKGDKYSLYNIALRREAINFGITAGGKVSIDSVSKMGIFWGPASSKNKMYIIADTTSCFGVVSFLVGCSNGMVDVWTDFSFSNILWSIEQDALVNAKISGNEVVITNLLYGNSKGGMVKVLSKKYNILGGK